MTESPQTAEAPAVVSASASPLESVAAKAEADSIIRDKSSPYWDSGHYLHHQTVDHVTALMSQVHGEVPAFDELGNTEGFNDQIAGALEPPADQTEYDFSDVALEEGQEWDGDLEADARDWFHRADVSVAEQVAFTKRYQEVVALPQDAREQMHVEATATLERSWGGEFDSNVAIVEAVIDALGDNFRQTLVASGMNNDVSAITALLRIGRVNGIG